MRTGWRVYPTTDHRAPGRRPAFEKSRPRESFPKKAGSRADQRRSLAIWICLPQHNLLQNMDYHYRMAHGQRREMGVRKVAPPTEPIHPGFRKAMPCRMRVCFRRGIQAAYRPGVRPCMPTARQAALQACCQTCKQPRMRIGKSNRL